MRTFYFGNEDVTNPDLIREKLPADGPVSIGRSEVATFGRTTF